MALRCLCLVHASTHRLLASDLRETQFLSVPEPTVKERPTYGDKTEYRLDSPGMTGCKAYCARELEPSIHSQPLCYGQEADCLPQHRVHIGVHVIRELRT